MKKLYTRSTKQWIMDDTSEQAGSQSFRRRFFAIICPFTDRLYFLLTLEIALLLMVGFSALINGFKGPSGIINLFNLVIVGTATGMTAVLVVLCRREQTNW